ncbi:MAG: hypothetical protein ACOZFS_06420 [Thermodesulfobacteriota bacterium]
MKPLSKYLMVLALGAVITLPGIAGCKKTRTDPRAGQILYQRHNLHSYQLNQANQVHTPIPGSLLLVGSGVAGLAILRWRKRIKR